MTLLKSSLAGFLYCVSSCYPENKLWPGIFLFTVLGATEATENQKEGWFTVA